MNWSSLDKTDSDLYKGVAILMIATHNFMHQFPVPRENEFTFDAGRFYSLLGVLWDEPENSIQAMLSFFGHFGVQIFIFLSAYGLTKKYLFRELNYWPFIWRRVLKIYPSFILAILAWAVIRGWVYPGFGVFGPLQVLYGNIESLILKLTLLSPFFAGQSLSPVGPWWFIPFIFHFYVTFPFLLKLYVKWGGVILVIVSAMSILFSAISGAALFERNIYVHLIGHLPELCLGIYIARNDDPGLRISTALIVLAFTVYVLGNLYEVFWYAGNISFLIVLLAVFNWLIPKIKAGTISNRVFLFFGSLSMQLFLVNGFLRKPFITWAKDHDQWLLTIVLCLVSLLTSVVVALILSKIERHVMSKTSQANATA